MVLKESIVLTTIAGLVGISAGVGLLAAMGAVLENVHNSPFGPPDVALMTVLVMAAISLLVLAGAMQRTSTVVLLNERHNQYATTICAAEAATEKVIGRMRSDYSSGSDSQITLNLDLYRGSIPTTQESSRWGDFQFTDAQGGCARHCRDKPQS